METWSAHHLFQKATEKLDSSSAVAIQQYAMNLKQAGLPVIFSLGHLSKITGVDYQLLHDTTNRKREAANYNLFAIKKRLGGRRFIHAVNGKLFYLQKYINDEVLQKIRPHSSSFAFHKSGGIKKCAAAHCGCKWLLQFDLKDFFYTISESMAYHVFISIGYKPLLSFEMARLCTTLHLPKSKRKYLNHSNVYSEYYFDDSEYRENVKKMPYFPQPLLGVLPQGAPSSPMISNLVGLKLDEALYAYAKENSFVYTRYADDLTFSATVLPGGKSIGRLKRDIISLIRKSGFWENQGKIRIAGPGSKKIVLGLLVDGASPRISRELYKRIDRNLYSIEKFGIEKVAEHDGFESTYGFINHLSGLLSFIKDVDLERWKKFYQKFSLMTKDYNFE